MTLKTESNTLEIGLARILLLEIKLNEITIWKAQSISLAKYNANNYASIMRLICTI